MKFRKKPVVVEATQIRAEWFDWKDQPPKDVVIGVILNPMKRCVEINTLEGVMIGQIGDWIITGVNGEKYPCKPDIFLKTYESIDSHDVEEFYDSNLGPKRSCL